MSVAIAGFDEVAMIEDGRAEALRAKATCLRELADTGGACSSELEEVEDTLAAYASFFDQSSAIP